LQQGLRGKKERVMKQPLLQTSALLALSLLTTLPTEAASTHLSSASGTALSAFEQDSATEAAWLPDVLRSPEIQILAVQKQRMKETVQEGPSRRQQAPQWQRMTESKTRFHQAEQN
jgi:hypothetical protein